MAIPDSVSHALAETSPAKVGGGRIEAFRAVPTLALQEQAAENRNLAPSTIITLKETLADEVHFAMSLQDKNQTLEPYQASLLNQIRTLAGVKDGEKLTDEKILGVIEKRLNSKDTDPNERRVWEELGDRVMKQHLADIQVYTEALLSYDPAPKEEYVAHEDRIGQTAHTGEKADAKFTRSKRRFWNIPGKIVDAMVHDNDPTGKLDWKNGRKILVPFGMSVTIPKWVKHETSGKMKTEFPDKPVFTPTKTIDGSAARAALIQKKYGLSPGQKITAQMQQRIRQDVTAISTAMQDVSVKRHGGSISRAEDFNFVQGELNVVPARIQDLINKQAAVRNNVPNAPALTTDETRILTAWQANPNYLPSRTDFHTKGMNRDRVNLQIEGLASGETFPVDFSQEDPVSQLNRLSEYLKSITVDKVKEIEERAHQKSKIDAALAVAQSEVKASHNPNRYSAEIQGNRNIIEQVTQELTDIQEYEQALQEKNAADRIQGDEKEYNKINAYGISGWKDKTTSELNQTLKNNHQWTGDDDDNIEAIERALAYARNLRAKKKLERAKQKLKDRNYTDDEINSELGTKKTDAQSNKQKAETEIQRFEALAQKKDVGAEYRVRRIQSVQQILYPEDPTKLLQRMEYGKMDVQLENATHISAHPASTEFVAFCKENPTYPPVYLHMAYVLMGKAVMEPTTVGRGLLKKAAEVITPQELYAILRNEQGWTAVEAALGGDAPPISIYSDVLNKAPVRDALLGLLTTDVMTRVLNQAKAWAIEGFNQGGHAEYVRLIQDLDAAGGYEEIAGKLSEEEETEISKSRAKLIEAAGNEVVRFAKEQKFNEIDTNTADGRKQQAALAAEVSKQLKLLNIYDSADLTMMIGTIATTIDSDKPNVFDNITNDQRKNEIVGQIARELLRSTANTEDLEKFAAQADHDTLEDEGKNLIKNRMDFADTLSDALALVYQDQEYGNNLMFLSAIMPYLETSDLAAIQKALDDKARSGDPSFTIDVVYGAIQGDKLEEVLQRFEEACYQVEHPSVQDRAVPFYSAETVRSVLDTMMKEMLNIHDPTDHSVTFMVDTFVRRVVRQDLARSFDDSLIHMEPGPEMVQEIIYETGQTVREASVIASMIADRRKRRAFTPQQT